MSDTPQQLIDELFDRDPVTGLSLACLVVRGGRVVGERYGTQPADDFQDAVTIGPDSTLLSWSMAKSITHAAVGLLVADGLLDPGAPAPVPEWRGTDKARITLDHLLEMRSGLAFVEDYVDGETSNCIEMLFSGTAPSFAAYAAALPLVAEPGTVFNYSSGTTNIVARIVGDVVAGSDRGDPQARRSTVEEFLRDRLFRPAGMTSAIAKFDDAGDFVGSSYVYATARDFARFGELYLRDGIGPSGDRVIASDWVRHGTEWTAHDPESGFDYARHFWKWPAFPGSFSCHGYEGQFVLVDPAADLVVVHLGKTDVTHQRGLTTGLARIAQSAR